MAPREGDCEVSEAWGQQQGGDSLPRGPQVLLPRLPRLPLHHPTAAAAAFVTAVASSLPCGREGSVRFRGSRFGFASRLSLGLGMSFCSLIFCVLCSLVCSPVDCLYPCPSLFCHVPFMCSVLLSVLLAVVYLCLSVSCHVPLLFFVLLSVHLLAVCLCPSLFCHVPFMCSVLLSVLLKVCLCLSVSCHIPLLFFVLLSLHLLAVYLCPSLFCYVPFMPSVLLSVSLLTVFFFAFLCSALFL